VYVAVCIAVCVAMSIAVYFAVCVAVCDVYLVLLVPGFLDVLQRM